MLRRIEPLHPRVRPLIESFGDVLAEDIVASIDLPRFTNSAMDGVAVRASATASATPSTPVRLSIAGTIDAGTRWTQDPSTAQAFFIGTGAPLPEGFDAVVPIEETRQDGQYIIMSTHVASGANVRPRGDDIHSGTVAVRQGAVLRAQEVALLAALGVRTVAVHHRPAVSILSTGLELVAPDRENQIHDANGPLLAALVETAGGEVVRLAQSNGELADLRECLDDWSDTTDLVITSGGISNSLADTMTSLLADHPNAELWDVRLRPGKHFGFAWFDHFALLALPGNPIAAMVGFELFARLAIERIGGRARSPLGVFARVTEPLHGKIGRTDAIRGRAWLDDTGQLWAVRTENRGSGVLSSLADANCLLLLPEDSGTVAPGDLVRIHWLGYQ